MRAPVGGSDKLGNNKRGGHVAGHGWLGSLGLINKGKKNPLLSLFYCRNKVDKKEKGTSLQRSLPTYKYKIEIPHGGPHKSLDPPLIRQMFPYSHRL